MIWNNLILSWRNLWKHKVYSGLNISGFALGLAASFLLFAYVIRESRYEKHLVDHERIYRIGTDFYNMGGFAKSQSQLLDYLPDQTASIDLFTRFDKGFSTLEVRVGESVYSENRYMRVDSVFFEMFSFPMIEGRRSDLITGHNDVVLSKATAIKYFGRTDVIGESITVGDDNRIYRITGVADKLGLTHLDTDIWFSTGSSGQANEAWTNISLYNYVRLVDNAGESALEAALESLLEEFAWPSAQTGLSFEDWKASTMAVKFYIQEMDDIYLHSNLNFEINSGGNPQQVLALGIIGFFLILIAGINYVNLITGRSSLRAKEIGVKKCIGASKRNLMRQFLVEALFTSVIAFLLALLVAELMLPFVEDIVGTKLSSGSLFTWQFVVAFLIFSMSTGLLIGIYPAFFLTRFRPVTMLKGLRPPGGNKRVRSLLVITQFGLASVLIICGLVVSDQVRFMINKDPGFKKDGLLVIENGHLLGDRLTAFKEEIGRHTSVVGTSLSGRTPAGKSLSVTSFKTPEMTESKILQSFSVDADFIPVLGFQLKEGRNFSSDRADSLSAIINEAAVAALELENPIGAEINPGMKVIGVVHDFNFQTYREKIQPSVLVYGQKDSYVSVRIQGASPNQFIGYLEQTWSEFQAEKPIQFAFVDEQFARLSENEQHLASTIHFFTLLIVIISCLGLFGLTHFLIERRTREIGVRKVLGATVANVVRLLTLDFLRPVLVGLLIASPVAWFIMSQWLHNFAYHTAIGTHIFIFTALAVVLLALTTVSVWSLRTALANPVDSLRDE